MLMMRHKRGRTRLLYNHSDNLLLVRTMKLLSTTAIIFTTVAATSAIDDQSVRLQRPMYPGNPRPSTSSAAGRRLTTYLRHRQLKRDDNAVSEETPVDNEAVSDMTKRRRCVVAV